MIPRVWESTATCLIRKGHISFNVESITFYQVLTSIKDLVLGNLASCNVLFLNLN